MCKLVAVFTVCLASVLALGQTAQKHEAPTEIGHQAEPNNSSDAAALDLHAIVECDNAGVQLAEPLALRKDAHVNHSAPVSTPQAQNSACHARAISRAAGEQGSGYVSAVLAKVNQSVSELSEQTETAITRYPNNFSILPFGGPMFVVSPRFPWGESIPMLRISVPPRIYSSPSDLQ